MEEKYCKNCLYYLQHYTLCENRLIQVYCGHSSYKTPKTKCPDRKACEHFQQGIQDKKRFVCKEHLCKKLLEKVPSMELLPEIEEHSI